MDSTSDTAVNEPAPSAAQAPASPRQLDPIDRPARPLGAKRFALQAQRQRHSTEAWRTSLTRGAKGSKGRVITSGDGTLAFAVIRTTSGLLIERRHWPAAGLRVAQTMTFDDATDFDRWCDTEPLRFEEPQLHAQLRREAHEVLDGDR